MIRRLASAAGLMAVALGVSSAAQEARHALPVAAPAGFIALKADLHLHSVFSDGEVWPTVHVREAWRDGLDVIALTEHREYRPHARDLAGGAMRAYAVARPLAEQLGILLVPGAEITRPVPGQPSPWPVGSAHFNAFFVDDDEPFGTADLGAALEAARDQKAFIAWNHPLFMGRPAEWYPHVDEMFRRKLFQGIEIVNGDEYSADAFGWALDRRLTILACSDAHLPMPAHLRSERRPVTLIYARSRDLASVREALDARRTVAWLDNDAWGEEPWLQALWSGAIRQPSPAATLGGGSDFAIALDNTSPIDFDLTVLSAPPWVQIASVRLRRMSTGLVKGRVSKDAPAGPQEISLAVRVNNLHVRPDAALTTQLTLKAIVER
jgi:hypothetical protein